MARRALLVIAVAGVLGAALPASALSKITVDPLVGTPDTAFHIQIPATYAIHQIRDRYWFILHGPGGKQCEGSVTDRVGITPPARAKTVAVDLPGVRVVNSKQVVPGPWCVGSFSGHVEFRDWRPRSHKFVTHRIGSFSVTVQESTG
jgi:hypothetical protein